MKRVKTWWFRGGLIRIIAGVRPVFDFTVSIGVGHGLGWIRGSVGPAALELEVWP